MTDDPNRPELKVTDRRHFDQKGEKRPPSEISPEPEPTRAETPGAAADPAAGPSGEPAAGPKHPSAPPVETPRASTSPLADEGPPEVMSELAASLSSSFSLLVARLAQETEIYLGLIPYPGKETAEPDLEAARAMIDLLSMLQEKTRGNLDVEEARLLENLLYQYRLEYVRRRSDAGAR
jgi:hypothetical protein